MLLGWGESRDKEREKRLCPPLRLKLPHFFPCMCPAWTIQSIAPSHSTCAPSPKYLALWNLHNDTIGALKIFSLCVCVCVCARVPFSAVSTHFCNSSSVNHCAVRAAQDVRLWRAAAPIDKNPRLTEGCIQRHRDMHALFYRAACSRSWAAQTHHHKGTTIMMSCNVRLGGNRTCILSDVNTSVSTSQAMMVTISSFIFIDGIPLRGWEGKKKNGNGVKVSLFLSSRSHRQSVPGSSSGNLRLSPADCSGSSAERVTAGLLTALTRRWEWCCSSRANSPSLSLSLSLSPSLLLPPLSLSLSLSLSSPPLWLHIDVITILTIVVFYATTGLDEPCRGHCRIHGPVYSAFSCIFVCFVFKELLEIKKKINVSAKLHEYIK